MNQLDVFKGLVDQFEKLQEKYAKAGADDTEPDAHFQWLLVRAFKGKKPEVKDDPRTWQLYSDHPMAARAAQNLATAAQLCVDQLGLVTIGDSAELRSYLEDYCWRIDW